MLLFELLEVVLLFVRASKSVVGIGCKGSGLRKISLNFVDAYMCKMGYRYTQRVMLLIGSSGGIITIAFKSILQDYFITLYRKQHGQLPEKAD